MDIKLLLDGINQRHKKVFFWQFTFHKYFYFYLLLETFFEILIGKINYLKHRWFIVLCFAEKLYFFFFLDSIEIDLFVISLSHLQKRMFSFFQSSQFESTFSILLTLNRSDELIFLFISISIIFYPITTFEFRLLIKSYLIYRSMTFNFIPFIFEDLQFDVISPQSFTMWDIFRLEFLFSSFILFLLEFFISFWLWYDVQLFFHVFFSEIFHFITFWFAIIYITISFFLIVIWFFRVFIWIKGS